MQIFKTRVTEGGLFDSLSSKACGSWECKHRALLGWTWSLCVEQRSVDFFLMRFYSTRCRAAKCNLFLCKGRRAVSLRTSSREILALNWVVSAFFSFHYSISQLQTKSCLSLSYDNCQPSVTLTSTRVPQNTALLVMVWSDNFLWKGTGSHHYSTASAPYSSHQLNFIFYLPPIRILFI